MMFESYKNEVYKTMVEDWKANQRIHGRNTRPGEGTRRRLWVNSEVAADGVNEIYTNVYYRLLKNWMRNKKREKSNSIPGQGTRNRFRREAMKAVFV